MTERIVLVRHGRSAHVQAGRMNRDEFQRWREAYEAAGIVASDALPRTVAELAAESGIVLASDAPRAIESARLFAAGREVTISPLLRELELTPPRLRGRWPLLVWALAFGVRHLAGRGHWTTAAELARAGEAATWITALARTHGSVVAVTHASFRAELAKALVAGGWRRDEPRQRSSKHWSAWRFSR